MYVVPNGIALLIAPGFSKLKLHPFVWSKPPSIHNFPQGCAIPIRVFFVDPIAPPVAHSAFTDVVVLWKLQSEIDHNNCDGGTRIQRGGENVVVLCPPWKISSADGVLKYKTDNRPGYEVNC